VYCTVQMPPGDWLVGGGGLPLSLLLLLPPPQAERLATTRNTIAVD
jgi:hypothetical protein